MNQKHVTMFGLTLVLAVYLSGALKALAVAVLLKISIILTHAMFALLGVPVAYHTNLFNVNHMTVEISEGCSGIRSLMPMVILALAAAYFYLRSTRLQMLFIGMAVAVAVVMNSVRIVTLALLGGYVNPRFFTGQLHEEGSLVFFLASMVLLVPWLWWLQRSEGTERHA
jgi:exosortase